MNEAAPTPSGNAGGPRHAPPPTEPALTPDPANPDLGPDPGSPGGDPLDMAAWPAASQPLSDPDAFEPIPVDLSAEDKPPPSRTDLIVLPPPPATPPTGPSVPRLVLGLLAAALLIFSAFWILDDVYSEEPNGDLTGLIARSSTAISTFYEMDTPDDVAQALRREFDWRISVPAIQRAELRGLGFSEILPGVTIPVLLYREASGLDIPVSIVNYVFMDKHEGLLSLSDDLLRALETEAAFALPREPDDVFLWRKGDEIFLAASDDRAALVDRIAP